MDLKEWEALPSREMTKHGLHGWTFRVLASIRLPARHTMHLMAKAAVTVYEAAVENRRPED